MFGHEAEARNESAAEKSSLDGEGRRVRGKQAALANKAMRDADCFLTDGVGFEPTVRYERTHTFQDWEKVPDSG
jgi:hypothetical protein